MIDIVIWHTAWLEIFSDLTPLDIRRFSPKTIFDILISNHQNIIKTSYDTLIFKHLHLIISDDNFTSHLPNQKSFIDTFDGDFLPISTQIIQVDKQRNKGDKLEWLNSPDKYRDYTLLPLRLYISLFGIIKNAGKILNRYGGN